MDTRPNADQPDPADAPSTPTAPEAEKTGDDNGLLVPELRIQNFRGFRDLHMTGLGRVNLIVGKNSVGKSTVLDALRLLFDRGAVENLPVFLESKDEGVRPPARGKTSPDVIGKLQHRIECLFHGRPGFGTEWGPAIISTVSNRIEIHMFWVAPPDSPHHESQKHNPHVPVSSTATPVIIAASDDTMTDISFFVKSKQPPGLLGFTADNIEEDHTFSFRSESYERKPAFSTRKSIVSLSSSGDSTADLTELWDQIALSDIESSITSAVQLAEPSIVRIAAVNSGENRSRIFVVKLKSTENPVTLKSLGEGAVRLFNISLAVGNASGGIFLIDEIENGLHWSVQLKMWEMIFSLAEKLNVQVFATTHSYDCVRSFCAAARKHPSDGVLVRLERKPDGDIGAFTFDEETLEYAMQEEIEVR